MTKAEIEALRQRHAEAHKAYVDAVEEYKAGRPGDSPISAEEWDKHASEKLRKARADFVKAQNELIGIEAQQDLAAADAQMEEWDKRPITRLPMRDPNDAAIAPASSDRQSQSPLAREAFALEAASAGKRTQLDSNTITAYRGEARARAHFKLTEKEREAHRAWFGATLRYGQGDGEFFAACEKLKESVGREKYALLTSQGNLGGFLVSDDFQAEVIRDLAGFSVFRQVARVAQTGKDVMVWPTVVAPTAANAVKGHPSKFAGGWGAQADQGGNATLSTQDQPKFGQERIQVHRYQPDAVEVSLELLEDPDADVESILAEIMAETRGIDENTAFTEGTGVDRPLGITTESLTSVSSGSASALAFNASAAKGLLALVGKLPAQYRQNASLMMNSLTHTAALGLENATANKNLVFPQPSQQMISGQMFGSLMTYRVAFNEIMPNVGSNTYPIIFGDFRYYIIADRMELRVQRLIEKVAPNVAFLAIARMGGQTVRPNAFVRQKCAA